MNGLNSTQLNWERNPVKFDSKIESLQNHEMGLEILNEAFPPGME